MKKALLAALLLIPALGFGQASGVRNQYLRFNPPLAWTTADADSDNFDTRGVKRADIIVKFGTITGTYSTCTAQIKTSYNGPSGTFLTLGSAVSVTVTTGTVNAWSIIEQLGTTSVTSSAVSSTVALGFGDTSKITFHCTSFGTTAPVSTFSVIGK